MLEDMLDKSKAVNGGFASGVLGLEVLAPNSGLRGSRVKAIMVWGL